MSHLHLLGTVAGPPVERVADLRERMEKVASECAFHVRDRAFVQFKPVGATGVLVLAESHFSAHTFPEAGVCMVDVYCCAPAFDSERCKAAVERAFEAVGACKWHTIQRSLVVSPALS